MRYVKANWIAKAASMSLGGFISVIVDSRVLWMSAQQ